MVVAFTLVFGEIRRTKGVDQILFGFVISRTDVDSRVTTEERRSMAETRTSIDGGLAVYRPLLHPGVTPDEAALPKAVPTSASAAASPTPFESITST